MYITLFNAREFPYASFHCTSGELEKNLPRMGDWLKEKGYRTPVNIGFSPAQDWKDIPGSEFVNTFQHKGEPLAHIFSSGGAYFALTKNGGRILASDRLDMARKMYRLALDNP